jgi:hypothetical protein
MAVITRDAALKYLVIVAFTLSGSAALRAECQGERGCLRGCRSAVATLKIYRRKANVGLAMWEIVGVEAHDVSWATAFRGRDG